MASFGLPPALTRSLEAEQVETTPLQTSLWAEGSAGSDILIEVKSILNLHMLTPVWECRLQWRMLETQAALYLELFSIVFLLARTTAGRRVGLPLWFASLFSSWVVVVVLRGWWQACPRFAVVDLVIAAAAVHHATRVKVRPHGFLFPSKTCCCLSITRRHPARQQPRRWPSL